MKASVRNTRVGALLTLLVVAMVGASFAAVPLYRLFCQVTGYGGTTQVAETLPEAILDRDIVVRFNADVDGRLSWKFQPVQAPVTLKVGEPGLAFYEATNLSDEFQVGTASFNVTPLKAGQYFNKVECFCFTEQPLAGGETAQLPVSFFVDPAIAQDPNMDDVATITLSYTFFLDPDATLDAGLQRAAEAESPNADLRIQ